MAASHKPQSNLPKAHQNIALMAEQHGSDWSCQMLLSRNQQEIKGRISIRPCVCACICVYVFSTVCVISRAAAHVSMAKMTYTSGTRIRSHSSLATGNWPLYGTYKACCCTFKDLCTTCYSIFGLLLA